MKHFWSVAALITEMIVATTAHALVPITPAPYYTAHELAGIKNKASKGDVVAQSTLGRAYMYGLRIDEDATESLYRLNLAAKQNDGAAEEALGDAYLHGKGVSTSKSIALEWFRRAVADGQSSAQSQADELTGQQNYYIKLQAAAQTGDAAAQYAFAAYMPPERPLYYGHGWGDDDAVKWYRQSAEQGYAPAQAWMGFYYLMGAIRDESGPTAPHAAWEANDNIGLFVLGKAAVAAAWYEKAAAQGNEEAIHVLPAVYAFSRGYDTALLEKAMRASALRTLPSLPQDVLAKDYLAVDSIRGDIFTDLSNLCAWYDGESVEWLDNHLTNHFQIIRGQPQPDKALDCYRHEGDIGLLSGAYIVAYRTGSQENLDLAQIESNYRQVWDKATVNSGVVTRAAAHIGLIALARNHPRTAYAWLTMAVRGNMTAFGDRLPQEPHLADQAAGALRTLKITPMQKIEGDRQIATLSETHPLPSPVLRLPPYPIP